jgi:hypothetical protein
LQELQARDVVAELRRELALSSDIVNRITADRQLPAAVRVLALRIAERIIDDPQRLNDKARAVVAVPAAGVQSYRTARRLAEVAARLAPWEANYTTTLGLAQYRLGEFQKSIETLTLAVSPVTRSAIAAMARFRLGQVDEAKRLLSTVRASTQGRLVADELQALIAEATALIEGSD